MTTYKKPSVSLIHPSKMHSPMRRTTYHEFEMERHDVVKKVNCITALAVIALIVAIGALALAIAIFLQAFQTTEVEISNLAFLEDRVVQLEEQVNQNSNFYKQPNLHHGSQQTVKPTVNDDSKPINILVTQITTPSSQKLYPSIQPTKAEQEEEKTNDKDSEILHSKEEETYSMNESCGLPEDDEDGLEGSGDCPVYSRPICPRGYVVCNQGVPCPKPVCRKKIG